MSIPQSYSLRFEHNDKVHPARLIIFDPTNDKKISGLKYPENLFLNTGVHGYSDCQFGEIYTNGSISLVDCTAKAVCVAENVLLNNSSVERVKARGEVVALDCRNLKEIKASRIFINTPVLGVSIEWGDLFQLLPILDSNERSTYTCKNSLIKRDLNVDPQDVCVILDATTCLGDVIFPENSKIPEGERTVILRNGGRLVGEVIRGRLIDENGPQNSGDDLT